MKVKTNVQWHVKINKGSRCRSLVGTNKLEESRCNCINVNYVNFLGLIY